MLHLYTDGGCWPNPGGVGGWAWVLVRRGARSFDDAGAERETTNNRMELAAAINGLTFLEAGVEITVWSDSKYLVNGASKWVKTWRGADWTRKEKGLGRVPVKNADLWQELDGLQQDRRVEWRWLRGHSGHLWNELADQLASEAAQKLRFEAAAWEAGAP